MEIESRKRHFNEDTSKKKYEKNLALRVDLGIPQTDTAGQGQVFHKKGQKSGMIQESMSVCRSHFRHAL